MIQDGPVQEWQHAEDGAELGAKGGQQSAEEMPGGVGNSLRHPVRRGRHRYGWGRDEIFAGSGNQGFCYFLSVIRRRR